jgi:isopentenyl diphosphate isomerase/L-lactate dehydrogenase-like FMN-dependent dehydrogenase
VTDADRLRSVDDAAAAARARLDDEAWSFVAGGAGDGLTLEENRAAFHRWRLQPRVLTGMGPPDTTTTVLGCPVAIPILVAPFAGDTRFHPDGYPAVVRACAQHGTVAVVPELTSAPLEDVAAAAPDAARVFQLSLLGDEADFARLGGRAVAAGFAALCVTVDAPVVGIRRHTAAFGTAPTTHLTLGNFGPDSGIDVAEYFGHAQRLDRPMWTWARLADAAAGVGLPYAVKGILGAADARAAVEAGAAAVYVSNHGGRQLDPAPATLDVLAEVVAEVGDEVEVLLDGGVTSGADAVTALALGARAVLIGRAAAFGLAAAGQAGVARVLALLEHELRTTMTLLGRDRVAALDESALRPAPR